MELIRQIYHKYADSWIMQFVGDIYRNGFPFCNFLSYLRVRKIARKKNENRRIRVAFLCQYPPVWNKLKPVYEAMLNDTRFETLIVAIPENINKIDDKNYDYFLAMYGENVINSYQDSVWYDLHEFEPDYVFFQRPYDQYMPKTYRSGAISKYAKVCYVAYGYQLLTQTLKVCQCKKFFRNVYYFFAENSSVKEYNTKKFKLAHKQSYRKTVDLGYPALEDFMNRGKDIKKQQNDISQVLWTPRWTDEKSLGGSNFLNYKDAMANFVLERSDCSLMFRPHPMTFMHMVSTKKMTQKEVDDYLQLYDTHDRLEYDRSKDYTEVFWKSDILFTDVSSIMVEYFITGKPIIYCESEAEPDTFFKEIINVLYVVHSWEESKTILDMLIRGEDPKKEAREAKIKELFRVGFENISNNYLEEIYSDFVGTK